jgi:WhiB family transcriptional regulator, redox-sensing transcriptional regulator
MLHLITHSPFDGTQLCKTVDPDLFFPEDYLDKDQIEKAKAICNDCWIKNKCLSFAMENKEREGIWGGTTPADRKRLRRKARTSA